jgi:Kef-type K+ transport system membrane component KefB
VIAQSILATAEIGPLLEGLRSLSIEELLLPVLIQLIVIILASRAFAMLFRRLGQPSVVGEIAAGLVLGPSLLGWLLPGVSAALFHPQLTGVAPELSDQLFNRIFSVLSQIGLIFLLFLIGLEFDFSHLRANGKAALAISVVGVALPFVLGVALAPLLLAHIEPHPESNSPLPPLGFALFFGTALSITAIPILGRMMMELNITRTRIGAVTISAAAVDDATGWILLAAVAGFVRAQFNPAGTLLMIAETVGFVLVMIFLAKPLLRIWVRRALQHGDGLGVNALAVLLAVLFVCAAVTNKIGIFAIFGAFVLGAVLSGEQEFRQAVARRLRDLVTAFFLPIFFTYTGLRTNVGTLASAELWLLCGLVLAAAVVGKFGGCGLAAWVSGFSFRESACIGAMMNTRALMGLIVINVGYELQVIPPSVFCMLVLMALATTVITTPILLRLMRGTELEHYIDRSGFLRPVAETVPVSEPSVVSDDPIAALGLPPGGVGASAASPARGTGAEAAAAIRLPAGSAGTSASGVPFNAIWDS